jgi:hypothetical protein
MKVAQIASILNTYILPDVLGGDTIATEDLSNIVDIGIAIGDLNAYDKYVNKIINQIGKVVLADRRLGGGAPDIFKESWKYGSILEMLSFELPDAIDNSQQSLTNGQTYNQDVFYAPSVDVKFYNDRVTWQIPMSFLANGSRDDRIAQSFGNAEQCQIFWSGIELSIQNALDLQFDSLIQRTLNYYIMKEMYEDVIVDLSAGGGIGDKTGVRCVNVLKLYNDRFAKILKASECMTDMDFQKYASYLQSMYIDRLTVANKVFNMEESVRKTPKADLHYVTLSEYERAAEMYLQADTFHDTLVKLPRHEVVPFWQTPGKTYSFEETSAIKGKVKAIVNDVETSVTVDISGVIAIMFDDMAASVTNYRSNVTSHYNAKGDFLNNYYTVDAGFSNVYNQQFVIFYVADPS